MRRLIFFLFLILSVEQVFSLNELITRVPGNYSQKPGYIRNAVLVVEPHGAYTDQSLYLEYSDNRAFAGMGKVEIIHRFELPQGSVVNDLWLWINGQVMKAIMLDQWKARSIYDSIVSMKRDPAFLTKKGNQYELHVYPLNSDSTRKIKINFITPTLWMGDSAVCQLPLAFLKASAGTVPLQILFRQRENIWGSPRLNEFPSAGFLRSVDTMGYHYSKLSLPNIAVCQSLNMIFNVDFSSGAFFTNTFKPRDYNYFLFSLVPWRTTGINQLDSIPGKFIAAIDLSGIFNKNYSVRIPQLKGALKSAFKTGDSIKIAVAGASRIKPLIADYLPYSPGMIDEAMNSFTGSSFADSINLNKKKSVLYCDWSAWTIWSFTDIGQYVSGTRVFDNINEALPYFHSYDVICSYNHGYERTPTPAQVSAILSSLDSVFARGGRMVVYYDYNRVNKEQIAKNYIPSLQVKFNTTAAIDLHRNPDGNIGRYFPEIVTHNGGYFFKTEDSTVKAEMVDNQGNPCIISKKIGNNGLLVVTGIWPFNDDIPMRKIFAVPMLGLNSSTNDNMLKPVCSYLRDEYLSSRYDAAILFSDQDSLVTLTGTNNWIANYKNSFNGSCPKFKCVNLLDGNFAMPPSITINGTEFYGSGYLMNQLADFSGGFHLESHLHDWLSINSRLSPYSRPVIDSITISPVLAAPSDTLKELREILKDRTDPNRPLFFIGRTNSVSPIKFNVDVKFRGIDGFKHAEFTFSSNLDTTIAAEYLPAMLGNEHLKVLMTGSTWDTASIVSQAIKFNLLCDYTALLALEPNDTIHFLVNPFDESGFVLNRKDDSLLPDTMYICAFPNPFNATAKITFNIPSLSLIEVKIFDILGREVKELVSLAEFRGSRSLTWDAKSSAGIPVNSGIYFVRLTGREISTGKKFNMVKKIIQMK